MTGYVGIVPDGQKMDEYMTTLQYLSKAILTPIGIRIDTQSSEPTVYYVDANGNSFTPPDGFFNNHILWGGIDRVFYNRTTGKIESGINSAGTNKSLTGEDGDVLVKTNTAKVRYRWVDDRYHEFIVSPLSIEFPGCYDHPAAVMRGGTLQTKIYHSAYESSLLIDDTGVLKLQSVAGVQPMTGGAIKKLQFTSGGTSQITVDDLVLGDTSGAYGTVIGTYLSSGSWSGGDAAGYIYIKQPYGTFVADEPIIVSGVNCATASGAATALSFNLTNAETYAANKGSGFGALNYWHLVYLILLQVIEAGTLNIPSVFGRGIVDLPTGTGFAGKETGADDIDNRLDAWGTGTGSGADGQTPIKWRYSENLYGNVNKNIIGLNVFTDGTYRLPKRDGTGALADIMPDGSYEEGTGLIPLNDDYIKSIQTETLGALAFIPKTLGGTSSTYFCDEYHGPTVGNEHSANMYGGLWKTSYAGGPFYLSNSSVAGQSTAALGAHFEYYPPA